jgi:hypothetical protein
MTDTSHAADTSASVQELPAQAEVEALAIPTQPKGLGFQVLYGLANATIGIGNITFYTLLRLAGSRNWSPGSKQAPSSSSRCWELLPR